MLAMDRLILILVLITQFHSMELTVPLRAHINDFGDFGDLESPVRVSTSATNRMLAKGGLNAKHNNNHNPILSLHGIIHTSFWPG